MAKFDEEPKASVFPIGLLLIFIPEEVQDTGLPQTDCTKTTSKDVLSLTGPDFIRIKNCKLF